LASPRCLAPIVLPAANAKIVLWVLDVLVKPIWIAGSFAIAEATTTQDASRKASSLQSQHRNYGCGYGA
jgi:hypothetical protein